MSDYMRGSALRELRERKGLKAAWVAERAGFAQPHYSKIEAKASISVDEYVRVMQAMDLRPGDYLENSIEEVKPLLPLVMELKRFSFGSLEHVKAMIQAAAKLEENLLQVEGRGNLPRDTPPFASPESGEVEPIHAVGAGNVRVSAHATPTPRAENRPAPALKERKLR